MSLERKLREGGKAGNEEKQSSSGDDVKVVGEGSKSFDFVAVFATMPCDATKSFAARNEREGEFFSDHYPVCAELEL